MVLAGSHVETHRRWNFLPQGDAGAIIPGLTRKLTDGDASPAVHLRVPACAGTTAIPSVST